MKLKLTLKVIYLSVFLLTTFCIKSKATIFTVDVASFSFTPSNMNVLVGDTVRWIWVSGFHNTTSGAIPAGASPWSSPITNRSTSFDYVVNVAGTYNYTCTFHGQMVASFTASGPLPVKLSAFNVINENNNALLKWTTASEDNIDYFSIQKSKTSADFKEIGRVPAAGHSSEVKTYTFTDHISSSADKYFYYSIAIVDKDGKEELSKIELFKNKITSNKIILSLGPNPVSKAGHLMLKFNADRTGKMNVRLTSIEGKIIMQTTMQAYEGVNNGHLILGDLAAGSYSISFELDGIKEVHTLLVK